MTSNITHGRIKPTTIIRTDAQAAAEAGFVRNWVRKFPPFKRPAVTTKPVAPETIDTITSALSTTRVHGGRNVVLPVAAVESILENLGVAA